MAEFKTYAKKAGEVEHRWILVDASDVPLGRLASFVVSRLTGKYDPGYTPHMDSGDYVVVINAAQAVVTGQKETDKVYYHHSGFPGGIKDARLEEVRAKFPERIIENAVKGMLPKNKLQADRMKRLRVFAGSEHTHTAQSPKKVEIK